MDRKGRGVDGEKENEKAEEDASGLQNPCPVFQVSEICTMLL